MNKWTAISIISVLAVGAIVLGVFYFQETGKLKDARDEIVALEAGLGLVTFPDVGLEAAIREAINKPRGPINIYYLESLPSLEA